MPDIKYVCLSDMHLGAENSLLTKLSLDGLKKDFTAPSPVLVSLVDSIRAFLSSNKSPKKPTLILLGDILELALAETEEAGMVFDQFVDLILPDGRLQESLSTSNTLKGRKIKRHSPRCGTLPMFL